VKRGTLLIVDSCSEVYSTAAGEEGKVKYIVNHVIFTDDQIKNLRRTGHLPAVFDPKSGDVLVDESDDLLHANRNRRPDLGVEESSSSDDSSEDDDEESEEGSKEGENVGQDEKSADHENSSDD